MTDDEVQEFVDRLDREAHVRDYEVLSRRKNGEIFWMRLSASVIEIGGEPCRMTFAKEITEVKAAQEALRAGEERYHAAFQTTPDAVNISRIDDGMIVDVNQKFLDLTGRAFDEVVGHTTLEAGIWANPEDLENLIQELRRSSGCKDVEFQFKKSNGESFWARLSVLFIEIGGVPCMLSFARDVTEERAGARMKDWRQRPKLCGRAKIAIAPPSRPASTPSR